MPSDFGNDQLGKTHSMESVVGSGCVDCSNTLSAKRHELMRPMNSLSIRGQDENLRDQMISGTQVGRMPSDFGNDQLRKTHFMEFVVGSGWVDC